MTITNHELFESARTASKNAYVPYSHFPVGASLLTEDGTLFTGCNIENASFPLTNCGERTAIFKAISEGHQHFSALAVYGETEDPISPCGACRQVLVEFCQPDMPVYLVSKSMDVKTTTVGELLPYSFKNLS